LLGGTQKENMADMVARGRVRRGVHAPGAKLTPMKVRAIRKLLAKGIPHDKIAARFGVSRVTVTVIHTGRVWAWLK